MDVAVFVGLSNVKGNLISHRTLGLCLGRIKPWREKIGPEKIVLY